MKVKKIILIVITITIVLGIGTAFAIGGKKNKSNAKYNVVASNFASFDFLRAIIGEKSKDIELTFLLGPGKEAHSYDPTAGDLIKIQDSDLFVYVGGEMEKWSEKVLDSLDTKKTEIICISDFVETMEEKNLMEQKNTNMKEKNIMKKKLTKNMRREHLMNIFGPLQKMQLKW